jgi:hypothetical protein
MPEYRFFRVAQNGHIHEPPVGVDAANDAAALKLAREQLRSNDIEVWQGPRLVAYLASEQFSPVPEPCPDPCPDANPQTPSL